MTLKKILLALLLIFFGILSPLNFSIKPTSATTTQYVNAKNDIILRDAPKKEAKQIGKVKNFSKVKVYSSSNSFSYIQSGKVKGYVYTTALSMKNPKTTKSTVVTSGLSPAIGKSYTYEPSFQESGEKTTYKLKKEDGITMLLKEDYIGVAYLESPKRFEMGVANSDVFFFSFTYPMKAGSTIDDIDYGFDTPDTYTKVAVESTTATVKTKAGTFKQVVILNYPNGAKYYLAKGYGLIKAIDKDGKTSVELISVK